MNATVCHKQGLSHPFHLPWPALQFTDITVPKVKSELMVCLKLADRVIGILDINSTENCMFRHKSEVAAFQSIADNIAQAIHQIQMGVNSSIPQVAPVVLPSDMTPVLA